MGAMDIFNRFRMPAETDYDEEEYYEDEEPVEDPKAIRKFTKAVVEEDAEKKTGTKITSINRKKTNIGGMEVYGAKPKNINDAKEITQTLLENKICLINLEGINSGDAMRILDFAAGSAYALNASFQKVSNAIFIVAPESVDISGTFQEIINS